MKFALRTLALILVCTSTAVAQEAKIAEASSDDGPMAGRNFLIRVEPHWLVLHELSLDLQIKLGRKFTLGPTFAYMAEGDGIYAGNHVADRYAYNDKTDRTTVGLRGVLYFSGNDQSSAYISAFGKYSDAKVDSKNDVTFTTTDPDRKAEFNETRLGITGGYQWLFGRFTLNVGGGLSSTTSPDNITFRAADGTTYNYSVTQEDIGLEIDAGLGFQF